MGLMYRVNESTIEQKVANIIIMRFGMLWLTGSFHPVHLICPNLLRRTLRPTIAVAQCMTTENSHCRQELMQQRRRLSYVRMVRRQFGKSEMKVGKWLRYPEEWAVSFVELVMEGFMEKVVFEQDAGSWKWQERVWIKAQKCTNVKGQHSLGELRIQAAL